MKTMMLRRKKALNKAFSLIISMLMLVLCASIISANLNGVGGIGVAQAQDQAQDQSDDLGTYTPPPMFEGETKPLNADDLTILNGGVVKKPSPKSLLGFAEESPTFERVIGTNLPVPKRKPVQQVAVKTIDAIPPEISDEPAPSAAQTNTAAAASSDKIINEDSVTLLPDEHREALVDLLFVPEDKTPIQDQSEISEPIEPVSEQEDAQEDVAQETNDVEPEPESPFLAQSRPAVSDLGFRRPANADEGGISSSYQDYGLLTPPQDILDDVIAPATVLSSRVNKLASYPSSVPSASSLPRVRAEKPNAEKSNAANNLDNKPDAPAIEPIDTIASLTGPNDDDSNAIIQDDGEQPPEALTRAQDVARRLDIIKPNRAQENQIEKLDLTQPLAATLGDDQLIVIRLPFREGETDLGATHKAYMDEYVPDILRQVLARKIPRVEIKAFADHSNQPESDMRRLSLARALAVREYLLSLGIESAQMNVRALGPDQIDDQSSLNIVNSANNNGPENAWPKNDWVDIEIK